MMGFKASLSKGTLASDKQMKVELLELKLERRGLETILLLPPLPWSGSTSLRSEGSVNIV